jgi:transcriptional regulator with XRE-family HTH domain
MGDRRGDWKPATPLAELLYEYMWGQRPPLSAADLARKVGVSKQTIGNWLEGRTKPQPAALALVAQRTGIPLEDLYRAAGTLPPDDGHDDDADLREFLRRRGIPEDKIDEAIEVIHSYAKHSAEDLAHTA